MGHHTRSSDEPNRRAVVLGATGHLGQAVVRRLVRDGYSVTAATRRRDPPELRGLPLVVASGHADAPGQIDAWVEGHDLVVDAAAPSPLIRFVSAGPAGGRPVDHAVGRTRALIAAVRRHAARLVFVSSFVTLPRTGRRASDGLAVARRVAHPYFRAKAAMERLVLDAATEGVPAVIVNPGAFLGPWAHRSETSLVHHVLHGRVRVVADTVVNVIDVRDVARYVVAAAELGPRGRRIALAGHDVALPDLVARIARLGDVPAPASTVPAPLAEGLALWGEAALAWGGVAPPPSWRAASLIADATSMAPSAEQRALGVRVRPLATTLSDSVAWHRAGGAPGAR